MNRDIRMDTEESRRCEKSKTVEAGENFVEDDW